MMVGWSCFLLLLGTIGLYGQESKGHLLDIYSPVKAKASSSYSNGRMNFAPQLAIQADISTVSDNCFISTKQRNPWYRLKFKSKTSVFNVRLGVRKKADGKLPADFHLKSMNDLSIYVSNSISLTLTSEIEQRCGSPWNYSSTKYITFSCERALRGRYLHVTVSSTSPTYLLICSIVINREDGPVTPLDFSELSTTVTSSGMKSDQPAKLAIDRTVSSCSSLYGIGKTWLRVDVRTVRYIRMVRLLFPEDSEIRTTIFIGRSLHSNGSNGNIQCDKGRRASMKSWVIFTCGPPILGQYIYIERQTSSMNVCEIQVFYDTILNFYSRVNVAASGQRYENSSIWKPIDGVRGRAFEAAWISPESTKSWWRMEFPQRNAISSVIINTPFLDNTRKIAMLDSVVYIGDFSDGDGSSNTECNEIWTHEDGMQAMNCSGTPTGKYFMIASKTAGNVLFLNEITLYGCEEPEVMITTAVSEQTQRPKSVNLTCHGAKNGCNVTKVVWTGQDGKLVNSASEGLLDGKNASTIVVSNDSLHLPYTCTLEYAGKSVARSYTVRPTFHALNRTLKGSVGSSAMLQVMVTGQNPTVENRNKFWMKGDYRLRPGKKYFFSAKGMTLKIINLALNDSGNYTFTASNADGNDTVTITLTVHVLLQFRLNPMNRTVAEGKTASLVCSVAGVPLPIVTWLRNSTQFAAVNVSSESGQSNVTSTAIWFKLKRSDAGYYRCKADNSIGDSSLSDKAYLDIQYAPEFTVHPTSVTLNSSDERNSSQAVNLSCDAVGNPRPMVTWIMAPLPYSVDSGVVTNISKNWELVIKRAVINDSGHYRCLAWNTLGRSYSKWANIVVQERPNIVQVVNISSIGDRSATLKWKKPFDGYSNITHYNIYFQENCTKKANVKTLNGTKPTRTVLRDLRPLTKYCISIRAFNALGRSKISSLINVTTTAAVPSAPANDSYPSITSKPVPTDHPTGSSSSAPSAQANDSYPSITSEPVPTDHPTGSSSSVPSSPANDSYPSISSEPVPTGKTPRPTRSSSSVRPIGSSSSVPSTPLTGPHPSIASEPVPTARPTRSSSSVVPQFQLNPKNLTVAEGKPASLVCSVAGVPLPNVTWLDNSNRSASVNATSESGQSNVTSSAHWFKVNRSESGYYRCKADNAIGGSILSDKAYLDVQYAPEFTVHPTSVILNSSDETTRNAAVQLTCNAVGNPSPMVTWVMVPLTTTVYSGVERNISQNWELVIRRVVTIDSGHYRCLARNALGQSSSKWAIVVVQERPYVVQIVNISSVGTRYATLEWKKPFDGYSNITHYLIFVQKSCTTVIKVERVDGTEPTRTVLRDLHPLTKYCISIRAFNGLGGSKPSSPFNVTTKATEAPEQVRNVLLIPLSSNEINVNWVEPINSKGKISLYKIYYSVVKDDTSRKRVKVNGTVEVLGNVTSTIVRDLNKYTLYYVTVTAITVADGVRTAGEMSSPVTVMTLEDAPSAPVNVSVTSITNKPHQLLVTWIRPLFPNGVIREYNVNYRKSGYGPHLRGVLVVPGTSETAIVDELEAYTEYSVYIQAYTNKGGDLSSIAIGRTDEGKPSVPTNFTSIYITHNSTLLKWNPPRYPRGRITKYEIQYIGKKSFMEGGRQQEDSRNNTVIQKHLNDLQMALHDLIPDTTFTFTVVAFTRNGPGEIAVIGAKTDIDWPIQPKMPIPQGKLRRTLSGVQVELVQPSNRHGTIRHVDLLLAKLISGPGMFHVETSVSYTTSLPGNVVYITARFKYEEVPTTFIIGDGKSYGGYFNGPLEGGFSYSYAMRSYSVGKSNQVLFSTSPNIYFPFEVEKADSKPTDGAGTTVVICVVAVVGTAIVSVLVIVAVRLRNRQRGGTSNPNVNKSTSDPGNEVEAEKSERSKDKKSLEHSMTASSLYAQSSVSSAVKDTQNSILEPAGSAPDHLYESLEMTVMTSSPPSEVIADKSKDDGNESSATITYEATTDVDAQ